MGDRPKYWERTPLCDLADDLDECYETPVMVLGVLKRLLGEVQDINDYIRRTAQP